MQFAARLILDQVRKNLPYIKQIVMRDLTVLSITLFLLYINYLLSPTSKPIRSFADA